MTLKLNAQQIKELVKSELTCGDCRGLNKSVLLPNADTNCGQQGMTDDAKICNHFRSDVHDLKRAFQENGDKLVAIFSLFSDLEDKDLRLVAGLLLKEHVTRKHGFKLGQAVFVRYRGRDGRNYLNNFMAGRILDIDDKEIRIINEEGTTVLTYVNDEKQYNSAIYDKESFREIRQEMIDSGKLVDPEAEIKTARRFLPLEDIDFDAPKALDGLAIPMMDDVVKGSKKAKTKKRTSTLLDLVSLIESGHMVGSTSDDEDEHELDDDYETASKDKKKAKKAKKIEKGSISLDDLGSSRTVRKVKKVKTVKKVKKVSKVRKVNKSGE